MSTAALKTKPLTTTISALIVAFWGLALLGLTNSSDETFEPNDPTATPTFMVIGAAKGGTTDLYYQIAAKSVVMDRSRPDPPLVSKEKEIRYLHLLPLKTPLACPSTLASYLGMINHPCHSALSRIGRASSGGRGGGGGRQAAGRPSSASRAGSVQAPAGTTARGDTGLSVGPATVMERQEQQQQQQQQQQQSVTASGAAEGTSATASPAGEQGQQPGQQLPPPQQGQQPQQEEQPQQGEQATGETGAIAAAGSSQGGTVGSASQSPARHLAEGAFRSLLQAAGGGSTTGLAPVCNVVPRQNPVSRHKKYIVVPTRTSPERLALEAQALNSCMARHQQVYTIDASPMYLMSPAVPRHLETVSPNTKIIMMLRDPVSAVESLYYHRFVTQAGVWRSQCINTLVDRFLQFVYGDPRRTVWWRNLASCRDAGCLERNWQELWRLGIDDDTALALFANSLYSYSLGVWRQHLLKPGRVIVIDSHAYYRDREGVMEQVVRFLYGRNMTETERTHAQQGEVQNAKKKRPAGRQPWVLTKEHRAKLARFMTKHSLEPLERTLQDLRREGAWVVGFDGAPWPWAPRQLPA